MIYSSTDIKMNHKTSKKCFLAKSFSIAFTPLYKLYALLYLGLRVSYTGQNNSRRAHGPFVSADDAPVPLNRCKEFASLVLPRQFCFQWVLLLFTGYIVYQSFLICGLPPIKIKYDTGPYPLNTSMVLKSVPYFVSCSY